MGVKLTFRKDFEASGAAGNGNASILPYTTDGKPVDDVLSCSITQTVESCPEMTITVLVRETFAENTAARLLTGKKEVV